MGNSVFAEHGWHQQHPITMEEVRIVDRTVKGIMNKGLRSSHYTVVHMTPRHCYVFFIVHCIVYFKSLSD